jgi:hypothetical protein
MATLYSNVDATSLGIEVISHQELSAGGTFSVVSWTNNYREIRVSCGLLSLRASTSGDDVILVLNGDTTNANYGAQYGYMYGTSNLAASSGGFGPIGTAATVDGGGNYFSSHEAVLTGPTTTGTHGWVYRANKLNTGGGYTYLSSWGGATYTQTGAITSVQVLSWNAANFQTGSWVTVFGVGKF